jgi:hypothetical protein
MTNLTTILGTLTVASLVGCADPRPASTRDDADMFRVFTGGMTAPYVLSPPTDVVITLAFDVRESLEDSLDHLLYVGVDGAPLTNVDFIPVPLSDDDIRLITYVVPPTTPGSHVIHAVRDIGGQDYSTSFSYTAQP